MITKVTTFNLFLPSRVYFFDSSKCSMVCKAYEYVVGLVKHLNGTRETYDARMRLFNDKLDIIFERLNAQAATAKKPAFPTRPKRLRDLPALLFRDLPLYFLQRI